MAYEFKLPDLGEGLTEGEIARWLVSEGQEVAEDDPLVEIQTDKTTVEIPSPAAGKVARILVAEGDVVPVGTVLVVIGEDGAATGQPQAEPQPSVSDVSQGQSLGPDQKGRVRATPLVRRLAQELGVELESLEGTGPQGRVTEEDVRAVLNTWLRHESFTVWLGADAAEALELTGAIASPSTPETRRSAPVDRQAIDRWT